jgi:hypothetical protein
MIPWGHCLPHSTRRMHSQLAFTSGGWLTRNNLKGKGQTAKVIEPLQFVLVSLKTGIAEMRKIPASW